MTIIYQLLTFYLLISMRIQQSIFLIIVIASTLINRSAVPAFTDKLCRPINRFLQVALYFSFLILTIDSYFALFMRLCLSAQECIHLMGKFLLGVGTNEIGMSTNIVLITLQLTLIGFTHIGNPFKIKDTG